MGIADFFLGYDGRIGRLAFLGGSIVTTVGAFGGVLFGVAASAAGLGIVGLGLGFGLGLLAIWSGLCLQIKRLHDRDQSGWWLLINFVPFGQLYIAVVTLFLPGTDGYNRFGPPGSGGFTDGGGSIDPGGRAAWTNPAVGLGFVESDAVAEPSRRDGSVPSGLAASPSAAVVQRSGDAPRGGFGRRKPA